MANVLCADKQNAISGSLGEGSSIRSIERMTGVHRDTIMRLGVKVGKGCTALMDAKMRNLSCTRLECEGIWGSVGKKTVMYVPMTTRNWETFGRTASLTPTDKVYA